MGILLSTVKILCIYCIALIKSNTINTQYFDCQQQNPY